MKTPALLSLICLLAVSAGTVRANDPVENPLQPKDPKSFTLSDARHLLFRAGFGGTPDEVRRLHRMGLEKAVAWLVDYEKSPDILGPIEITKPEPLDYQVFRKKSEMERREINNKRRRTDQGKFRNLRSWTMNRILHSSRPLEEKMVLFWHNHFTTSYRDIRQAFLLAKQDDLLRKHATGNFGEMLQEVSKDPAMLLYLNNQQNRKGRANENYAREVMELFTLGLGNYTENDIKEAARAFTGWQVNRRTGEFLFNRRNHDFGNKTFLGKTGYLGGEEVLDHLLEQKACPPYIASKIFAWLAFEPDDETLRQALGKTLKRTDYEIKPLLRQILKSEVFYSEKSKGSQVKSPLMLLVSTFRMFGMTPPPADTVLAACDSLGQALLMPPNVKGWEGGLNWITTATLLQRYNLSGYLVKLGDQDSLTMMSQKQRKQFQSNMKKIGGARGRYLRRLASWDSGVSFIGMCQVMEPGSIEDLVDKLSETYLFAPLPPERRQALVDFLAGKDGSEALDVDHLGTPKAEAKIRRLIHLLMSTPEFQVC